MHWSVQKILVTASFLSLLGSSKSKQSTQFDPAKQAHTGKVWPCHERRSRNVGDSMYPARGSLGGHMIFSASAECSLTAAEVQLPFTSSCFGFLFLPIQGELPWSPSGSLVFPTYSYTAHTYASAHHKHAIWTIANQQIKFSKITGIPVLPEHVRLLMYPSKHCYQEQCLLRDFLLSLLLIEIKKKKPRNNHDEQTQSFVLPFYAYLEKSVTSTAKSMSRFL